MAEPLTFRSAQPADLPEIVRLLAEDELGRQREQFADPLPAAYYAAFDRIAASPDLELIVAEMDGRIVGTLQLIFIPSLSYQGGLRAQVESVRVDEVFRNQGIGKRLMEWALERARARGAHLVQLTTHQNRTDAHRFYERLGFSGSHLGMKISLKKEEKMTDNAETPDLRHNPAANRFELAVENHLAVLEYRQEGGTITFTHTSVPAELGGRGLGGQLARAGLEYAREKALKVIPLCSFVAGYIEKHPEYRDLVG